jgi:hypothetical protein
LSRQDYTDTFQAASSLVVGFRSSLTINLYWTF